MNIMKLLKNMITVAALVLTAAGLSSCYIRISENARERLKSEIILNKAVAEGEVDTLTYNPGSFDSIHVDGSINELTVEQQDGDPKVEIIVLECMRDSVRITNEDGKLRIGFSDGTGWVAGPAKVCVYTQSLNKIISQSADIGIYSYNGDSLSIESSGSGVIEAFNIDLSGALTVNVAGSGDQDLRHITAAELTLIKAGSSDGDYSDINVGKLSVVSAGSGDTQISGKAESATISKKGSGEIDTTDLKVKDLHTED